MTTTDASTWDPRTEEDKLETLAELTSAMHHGRPVLVRRLDELAGGYSSAGDGRGPGLDVDGENDVKDDPEKPDTAKREREAWERDLARALDFAARAWERYRRLVQPRDGVEKLADPGCELCTRVEGHWCPVYGAKAVMLEPTTKKDRPKVQIMMLCQWCLQFTWPSRAGRLPRPEEVVAHSEGRKVRWHGGAEPRLVEVPCPECKDEDRKARRACATCGHAGKVLKQVSA